MNQERKDGQNLLSRKARKLLGRAYVAGVDPSVLHDVVNSALMNVGLQERGQVVTRGDLRSVFDEDFQSRIAKGLDSGRTSLRGFDFSRRIPETSEIFTPTEARTYIDGCDYPESVDDLLLAAEVQKKFGLDGIRNMRILDAMCGPGRLGREFLDLGAPSVVFHDGDVIMTDHAKDQASIFAEFGQSVAAVTSPVDRIPLPDSMFDLIVCHNSTHQLKSIDRLHIVIQEFLRLAVPRGYVIIADYQRATTSEFLQSLEERLQYTRPEIVPLLIPSFMAAFSQAEFRGILKSIPDIKTWSVTDAKLPVLTLKLEERVKADPVRGHLMDYSPISLRAIAQKQ